MFAQALIGLKSFCNENTHLSDTTFKMGARKRNKFIAWIWIYPYTVLDSDESRSF